jgi:hypothetical protein
LAGSQLLRRIGRFDRDATIFSALIDSYDLSDFLDDSGKHKIIASNF